MADPLLTICVPTFNRELHLRRLLASLDAEIGERDEVVVLVSDNASSDGTEAYLRDFAASHAWLQVKRQSENLGANGNIRWLVENAAATSYLWIFCDDDLLVPGSLATLLGLLHEHEPAWLFLPHHWTSAAGDVVGGSPAPGTVERYDTARDLYLAYHHWLSFATGSILRADRLREAVREVKSKSAYCPLLWYFRAGLEGPCVVAPEHVLRASQEISWAEQAYIFQTLHFTDLYDEGLHRGMSQEDFGGTLDGLYNGGFGLDHWRRMPLEMLEERVARFPQSAGLRGYLWVIARERALREPLAVIDEATRATGADDTARALVDEGEAAFAAGDLEGAAQRFRVAAQLMPHLVTAWNDLAVVLHELGRLAEAQAAADNALFADPTDEDAAANREMILGRQPV